jgi:hypothetical protein
VLVGAAGLDVLDEDPPLVFGEPSEEDPPLVFGEPSEEDPPAASPGADDVEGADPPEAAAAPFFEVPAPERLSLR